MSAAHPSHRGRCRLRGPRGPVYPERTGAPPSPRFLWLQEGKCGLILPRGALGMKRVSSLVRPQLEAGLAGAW